MHENSLMTVSFGESAANTILNDTYPVIIGIRDILDVVVARAVRECGQPLAAYIDGVPVDTDDAIKAVKSYINGADSPNAVRFCFGKQYDMPSVYIDMGDRNAEYNKDHDAWCYYKW